MRLNVKLAQKGPIPLDAEFEVSAGQLLTLVGPSGSGKTTILRSIAGLYRPRSGRIDATSCLLDVGAGINLSPQQRNVGIVFQNYALFEHLTVAENVALPMQAEITIRNREVAELLELVNLSGLESRLPGQLSGGQRQRVALARALARKPDILLLDEPFSAVDLVTRRKLRSDLARIRESLRMPIVMVTHDLDEAYELSDVMVVLHHGRTLVSAAPREVMQRPPSVEVARLVGISNIFNGRVVKHETEAGKTLIEWNGCRLECQLDQRFSVGEEVDWLVPGNRIILHQRVRPSKGERENPVSAMVAEALTLGDFVQLTAKSLGRADESLRFKVPTHVAERNGIEVGEEIGLTLMTKGIHLMHRQ